MEEDVWGVWVWVSEIMQMRVFAVFELIAILYDFRMMGCMARPDTIWYILAVAMLSQASRIGRCSRCHFLYARLVEKIKNE